MKLVKIFLLIAVVGLLIGCQSAQDKAARSQEAVNRERLELVDKYQKCMKKAEQDKEQQAECEQYLKASEALK